MTQEGNETKTLHSKLRIYRILTLILAVIVLAETAWIFANRQTSAGQENWDFEVDSELAGKFDDALADGSIEVWFQPITDSQTGKTTGAEALSRWKDNDKYISPSVFVSVLEETGQVVQLDQNVFEKAIAFQKERMAAGEELFPISVNLSVVSTMQEGVVPKYAEIFRNSGLPDHTINIEVTETLDSDRKVLAEVVKDFRASGFLVEIDDFGAGYAAVSNLAVIPYDILKLDKSLIDEIGTERGETLLKDVIGMAKNLDMRIIAEGVETAEQVEFLRDAGCDGIQGYYYSKPLPPAEFTEYLK